MLSPRAVHCFLKYFDSIDEALSRRLVRKRAWDEEALTSLFTELLDKEAQQDHVLTYSHDAFVDDLALSDEPLSIRVRLETHSYPKPMEHYVTQSDIGLILSYQDQFDPESSFRSGWLLQAKRLFPDGRKFDKGFTARSKFNSMDSGQHERMKRIRDWAKCDFIRYLLYCPSPSALNVHVREELSSARSRAIGGHIFDYVLGLELRDDMLSNNPTTAAGAFVAMLDDPPKNLLDVHRKIFHDVSPFSWFVVSQLARSQNKGLRELHRFFGPSGSGFNFDNPVVEGLIRGDAEVIKKDIVLLDALGGAVNAEKAQILPAHTLEVIVTNGTDRPRSERHHHEQ